MNELVMRSRSRIGVLVVVALLAVSGAFGTAAFLTADDADAAGYPYCYKIGTTWKCTPGAYMPYG